MHSTIANYHIVIKYQPFTSTYIDSINHLNTNNNMETHLGKTTKVLFIWHENLAVCDLQIDLMICLNDSDLLLSCSLVYSFIYSY